MIQGFPARPSSLPGDTVILHVSTDAPQFRMDFYRQGTALEFMMSSDWQPGRFSPDHSAGQDWAVDGLAGDGTLLSAWAGYPVVIPDDWRSGVYIVMFVEGDGAGNPRPVVPPLDTTTADARTSKALLVIRSPAPGTTSPLLYKVPYLTYQAYNNVGGWSLYQSAPVTIHRPGGGTGGTPWDAWNYDPFDKVTNSPRQVFAHWDAPFIRWLEQGYSVDYCTDLDVHDDTGLVILSPYSLVLSIGHDEYYTDQMRDNLTRFVANGGNLALFSGNTCWWRVTLDDPITFRRTTNWFDPAGPNAPENALTGVSYRNAGEGDKDRPAVGYSVQHADYWPFEGTGLNDGDQLGQLFGLVGYECDGANFARNQQRPVSPALDDGTPRSFVILGTADTTGFSGPQGNAAATMGMYTQAGTVFTGATTDWPRVVAQAEPAVGRITTNVLDRMGGKRRSVASLVSAGQIVAADGFFSSDDGYRHAIFATRDGRVTEAYFHPSFGIFQTVIATIGGVVDIGAFYSTDDNFRHVLVATADGNLTDVSFNPRFGVQTKLLGNFPGMTRVAGFHSPDDNFRHAIVLNSSGGLKEIFYHPQFGQGEAALGTFDTALDIGAFFSTDDKFRHVVLITREGAVVEVFYSPSFGEGQAVIANVADAARVSAFFADDDRFFNRRVLVATGGGRVHQIQFDPHTGIMRSVLSNQPSIVDLGGFYTPDDHNRHAIVATTEGVFEVYYNP